jgi:transcriptional regulator with XRE-family HTH domain
MIVGWLDSAVHAGSIQPRPLRLVLARALRDARFDLRLSQREVAGLVGISRGYVAAIEIGRANPSLDVVDRIGDALGLEAALSLRRPIVIEPRQRDLVHARCSGYVDRRLRTAGWQTAREVEVVLGHSHGWIDLMAFRPGTGTAILIEIKTRLDDLGSVERQLGWYERSGTQVARRLGWHPQRVTGWLLVLASHEVETALRVNRDVIDRAFPVRARAMLAWLSGADTRLVGRGLAMIDPTSRRQEWLIRSGLDGRRSPARYADYAGAARSLGR